MAFVAQSHRPPAAVATGPALPLRQVKFRALGTNCEIQFATADEAQAAAYERAAVAWVQAFEAKYSRFLPGSLISRINDAAGRDWVEVDAEMEQLLKLCDSLHFVTQGVLDPTALPLLRIWNYKVAHTVLPAKAEIEAARALVGWKKVRREPGRIFLPVAGMALDFGGFGKEYAVDMVAQLAGDYGITNVLVDFGHDLRALGAPPGRPCWHIGLEDPKNPSATSGSTGVTGKGVASSGDYLRGFTLNGKRYGHIVDPRTGWPVANGCLQATVIANTCLQAGVLSTTAFVLGAEEGVKFIQGFPGAEGLLTTERARAQTRGFFNYVVS